MRRGGDFCHVATTFQLRWWHQDKIGSGPRICLQESISKEFNSLESFLNFCSGWLIRGFSINPGEAVSFESCQQNLSRLVPTEFTCLRKWLVRQQLAFEKDTNWCSVGLLINSPQFYIFTLNFYNHTIDWLSRVSIAHHLFFIECWVVGSMDSRPSCLEIFLFFYFFFPCCMYIIFILI